MQVTGTIQLLPPLAKYIFIQQHILLFIEDSNIFGIDLDKNTKECIKVKATKDRNGSKVTSMVHIEDSTLLVYCKDLSLKIFKTFDNSKSQNWRNLGYLIPYCLTVCSSNSAMFK